MSTYVAKLNAHQQDIEQTGAGTMKNPSIEVS